MTQVMIYDNQIAGVASPDTTIDQLPTGFTLADAPDLPLDLLYWDTTGARIMVKDPRPTDTAIWDTTANAWVEPSAIVLPVARNWDLLIASLRHSEVWAKVYTAASAKLKTSVAFSLLMGAFALRSLEDLRFALSELLTYSPTMFTPDDMDFIADRLTEAGFDPYEVPELFPAEPETLEAEGPTP